MRKFYFVIFKSISKLMNKLKKKKSTLLNNEINSLTVLIIHSKSEDCKIIIKIVILYNKNCKITIPIFLSVLIISSLILYKLLFN